MARRKRSRGTAPRGGGRSHRARRKDGWRSSGRSGTGKAARPPGGTLIPLTPARRRAADRRRLEKQVLVPAIPPGKTESETIDYHLAACVACARAGGRVLIDYWGKHASIPVHEKGRNDYVTIVDRDAEEAIVRLIRARFPDHAIIAEESPPSEGSVGYCWYIDPLDGTTNYIHGYPLFSVSVGLSDPQGMRAAAVYDPLHDEMFTGARGRGASLNGNPIHIASVQKLNDALLVTGFPFRSIERLDEYLASFRSFILGASGIRRDGSAALNLAYVACGRYDGFWEMGLSAWDVAAGSLIMQEAGGVVTDFQGRNGYIDRGEIIAAAPEIHPEMLRIVAEAYRK